MIRGLLTIVALSAVAAPGAFAGSDSLVIRGNRSAQPQVQYQRPLAGYPVYGGGYVSPNYYHGYGYPAYPVYGSQTGFRSFHDMRSYQGGYGHRHGYDGDSYQRGYRHGYRDARDRDDDGGRYGRTRCIYRCDSGGN